MSGRIWQHPLILVSVTAVVATAITLTVVRLDDQRSSPPTSVPTSLPLTNLTPAEAYWGLSAEWWPGSSEYPSAVPKYAGTFGYARPPYITSDPAIATLNASIGWEAGGCGFYDSYGAGAQTAAQTSYDQFGSIWGTQTYLDDDRDGFACEPGEGRR